jgi:hypothetical protein
LHDNEVSILAKQQIDAAVCTTAEHLLHGITLATVCFRQHIFETLRRQIAERI